MRGTTAAAAVHSRYYHACSLSQWTELQPTARPHDRLVLTSPRRPGQAAGASVAVSALQRMMSSEFGPGVAERETGLVDRLASHEEVTPAKDAHAAGIWASGTVTNGKAKLGYVH